MEWVFCHPEVETLELQGYRIIQGLLDFYAPLRLPAEEFQALAEGRQAAAPASATAGSAPAEPADQGLPGGHERCGGGPVAAAVGVLPPLPHAQDFVSGMTDQHAQDEYRALSAL